MKDILDDNNLEASEAQQAIDEYINKRWAIYVFILVIGEFILSYYRMSKIAGYGIYEVFLNALLSILITFIIALFIESIRYIIREFKKNKNKYNKPDAPFWFHLLESGFSIWIIFSVVWIIAMFFI